MAGYLGKTATDIASAVRDGKVSAREVVDEHLAHIATVDTQVCAFRHVRTEQAREEAEAVDARADRYALPLAGVPVAIKDNIAVSGEHVGAGSTATSRDPSAKDHEVVRRLRAAGAIIVGVTRIPELALFPTTDDAEAIARNPWDLDRTPGGSSGGSAAAVAAGMVPLAHGNDGLGSVRIPAACCGLVGLKPGRGVIPAHLAGNNWLGLGENGVLGTTVEDTALAFGVLAGRRDGEGVVAPGKLRIAVSRRSPVLGVFADAESKAALSRAARVLLAAGHSTTMADPHYPITTAAATLTHWFAAPAAEAAELGLDVQALQPRTQRHIALGRAVIGRNLARSESMSKWRARVEAFFGDHDLLLMPALATAPLPAVNWANRSWFANVIAAARFAPFAGPWNMAGVPAMSVPAGVRSDGLPASVQLVAPPGGEDLLLAVARQLEAAAPWPRVAPGWLPEDAGSEVTGQTV